MIRGQRRLAARFYRVLIAALPGDLVVRYGGEMEAMFLESLDQASASGSGPGFASGRRRRSTSFRPWGARSEGPTVGAPPPAAHRRGRHP